jgi:hypothetical protein
MWIFDTPIVIQGELINWKHGKKLARKGMVSKRANF